MERQLKLIEELVSLCVNSDAEVTKDVNTFSVFREQGRIIINLEHSGATFSQLSPYDLIFGTDCVLHVCGDERSADSSYIPRHERVLMDASLLLSRAGLEPALSLILSKAKENGRD